MSVVFLTTESVNKDMKSKKKKKTKIQDSYRHSILKLFNVLPNVLFITIETKRDY